MPFIYPHLALMPDAHLGKGATVGSVIPTLGAIIPAAVGVDIGCGMIAVTTQLHVERPAGAIGARCVRRSRPRFPLSAGKNNRRRHSRHDRANASPSSRRARRTRGSTRTSTPASGGCSWARSARGTTSSRSASTRTIDVWLFLHSGSRGVGNRIAQHHIKVAQRACASGGGSNCRTATWPTWWRAPTSSGRTSASCGGRSSSRCSTARR